MTRSIVFISDAVIALILLTHSGCSQTPASRALRLMVYNVENLFDTRDDSLTQDNDFLPSGAMKWTYQRYQRKLNGLYKTIVAAGTDYLPDIIAFCEVENRKVLEDLVNGTYLSKFNYSIIHEDSPDPRGIDVCLIYRPDRLKIIDYRYWIPRGLNREEFFSRSVLCARFGFHDDTLHVIINHWPSRRGGVLAGRSLRSLISAMVKEKADSICSKTGSAGKIIIAGDFNCTPDDGEIAALVRVTGSGAVLSDLSSDMAEAGSGTYRYRGTWEMIDQVIVSASLLSGGKGLYTAPSMLSVFRPDFLLKKDPRYPGMSPFSTYRGYRYQGGFSDHLPVILDLGLR